MSLQLFSFRIHTGQYDSDGELCLIHIGGRLIPDGPDHVWTTTPDGRKILRCNKREVEPVDKQEIVRSMMRENAIRKRHSKKGYN